MNSKEFVEWNTAFNKGSGQFEENWLTGTAGPRQNSSKACHLWAQ
jgi:hypothetical protein